MKRKEFINFHFREMNFAIQFLNKNNGILIYADKKFQGL